MACCAGSAEITCSVVGVRRAGEVGCMTLVTVGIRELIIPVRMACLAIDRRMRSIEGEFCRVMVERRRLPCSRRVAGQTCMAEITGDMVRIRCAGEIGCVALVAICIDQCIVAVCMACLALECLVGPAEREFRRVVIERGCRPCRRRMACLACLGKISRRVVRIRRFLVVCQVTLGTSRIGERVIIICMTRLALLGRVSAGQRELRRAVIEAGRLPGGSRVAGLTRTAEIAREMIRICCSLIIRCVALVAG